MFVRFRKHQVLRAAFRHNFGSTRFRVTMSSSFPLNSAKVAPADRPSRWAGESGNVSASVAKVTLLLLNRWKTMLIAALPAVTLGLKHCGATIQNSLPWRIDCSLKLKGLPFSYVCSSAQFRHVKCTGSDLVGLLSSPP